MWKVRNIFHQCNLGVPNLEISDFKKVDAEVIYSYTAIP